jgi:predicted TIM-barrel fold metal-dependent hydrolase
LGQYHWLTQCSGPNWPNLDKIKQNHHYADLANTEFAVQSFVHIEAGFNNTKPSAELAWLASSTPEHVPFKAISYIQIDSEPDIFEQQLTELLKAPNLIGIRDITEGQDYVRVLSKNAEQNLQRLAEHSLIFEAQFELCHLDAVKKLVEIAKRYPDFKIVINHAGFIDTRHDYTEALLLLSKLNNIYIKFSGQEHCEHALEPSAKLQLLLKYLGEDRVMFASNYPVCLMRESYLKVWRGYKQLVNDSALWHKLSYANAQRCYFD